MSRRLTVPATTPWAGGDRYEQAVHALRQVEEALREAGAGLGDVVRMRTYLARFEDLAPVARAYAEVTRNLRPAVSTLTCTMVAPEHVEFEPMPLSWDRLEWFGGT